MKLYILDTDHLTYLRTGHSEVTAHVAAVSSALIAVTIVTVDEQLTGWYTQLRKARDPDKLAWAYDGLFQVVDGVKKVAVLPFTLPACQRYFTLRKQLPHLGKMDLAIAAIVLEAGGILVTRNKGDFQQVPQLVFEDWTKP